MNSRLRRPAVALIATTLAASVLGIAPAAHAADGTVSGVVTGSGGPVEDVLVSLYEYDAEDDYWTWTLHDDYTDATGAYTITAPEGSYRIGFVDTTGAHVGEYHVDAVDVDAATTISVPSATPVDADLATAAHITGHVTGSGSDVEDVAVTAYRAVPDGDDVYYQWIGYDLTASNGTYDIGGLPAGTYRVEFNDGWFDDTSVYATEFYVDQPTAYSAEDVTLDPAETEFDIDAQLTLDSEISGRVTNASGDPLPETSVSAYMLVGTKWREVGYTITGDEGTYVIDGLPAGTYRVGFEKYYGDYHFEEYWNDHGRISHAQDLIVNPSQPGTGVNAQLILGEHDAEHTVTNSALPTITGAAVVGSTLTASVGSWSPTPIEYYFDWLRDGEFIMGQYGSTYVPTAADIGKKITVLVSAGAPDYDYGHAESAPTAPVVAAPVPPVPPAPVPPTVDVPTVLATILAGLDVSGKPKVGRTVKVTDLDLVLRTAVSYKFQWFAGTKKIKKATKYKLKVLSSMRGKKLSVKVTATAASTSKTVKLKVGKVR